MEPTSLKLVSYCPRCETRFNTMHAQVVGTGEETNLLHVTCKKCGNAVLALVLANKNGGSSVGLLTDLSYEDVLRIQNNKHISIDDVLNLHIMLKENNLTI